MGLFGFGSKKAASAVPSWLLKADAAITLARQTNTLGDATSYMTPSCGSDFADSLFNEDKEPVGLSRYRKIDWKMESATSWVKCVTYEDIALSHRVTVPLGEPFRERWIILPDEKKIESMEMLYE